MSKSTILAKYFRLSALRINTDFIHILRSRHMRLRTGFIPKVLLVRVCKLSFGVVRCLHLSLAGNTSVVPLQFWGPKWHPASRTSLAGDGSSSCLSAVLVCLALRISVASLKSEWMKPWVCNRANFPHAELGDKRNHTRLLFQASKAGTK